MRPSQALLAMALGSASLVAADQTIVITDGVTSTLTLPSWPTGAGGSGNGNGGAAPAPPAGSTSVGAAGAAGASPSSSSSAAGAAAAAPAPGISTSSASAGAAQSAGESSSALLSAASSVGFASTTTTTGTVTVTAGCGNTPPAATVPTPGVPVGGGTPSYNTSGSVFSPPVVPTAGADHAMSFDGSLLGMLAFFLLGVRAF